MNVEIDGLKKIVENVENGKEDFNRLADELNPLVSNVVNRYYDKYLQKNEGKEDLVNISLTKIWETIMNTNIP